MTKLQQGSSGLTEAMRQVTLANEELRQAADKCEDGRIEGYLDLEIASINVFTDDLADSTETLVINMKRAT